MSKKIEKDGETYIVSEDVEFEEIDTENMVETVDVSGIVDEYEKLLKGKKAKNELGKAFEKLGKNRNELTQDFSKVKFYLKYSGKEHVFSGNIIFVDSFKCSSIYKVDMPLREALQLNELMMKSQCKNINHLKPIHLVKIKTLLMGEENRSQEFVPPKGKKGNPSQHVERIKLKRKKNDKNRAKVEIEFSPVNWR